MTFIKLLYYERKKISSFIIHHLTHHNYIDQNIELKPRTTLNCLSCVSRWPPNLRPVQLPQQLAAGDAGRHLPGNQHHQHQRDTHVLVWWPGLWAVRVSDLHPPSQGAAHQGHCQRWDWDHVCDGVWSATFGGCHHISIRSRLHSAPAISMYECPRQHNYAVTIYIICSMEHSMAPQTEHHLSVCPAPPSAMAITPKLPPCPRSFHFH